MDSCKKINILPVGKGLYCAEVYAGMNLDNQELAQDELLYKTKIGKNRKIVFATNVAESSLTIGGIKYVIDSGLELSGYYDPDTKARVLEKKMITHAQAKQRMGRAGRTGPGVCYHLYTKNDFESKMEKFPQPTIRVSNISGECLRLLNLPIIGTVDKLKDVLNKFIEPPTEKYVKNAISSLMQLGLIENNTITTVGKYVAEMQVDPNQGAIIHAGYHMNCIKEIVAIIAMMDATKNNISELFISIGEPTEEQEKSNKFLSDKLKNAKKSLMHNTGDHMTLLKIFGKYVELRKNESKLNDWLYNSFLKRKVLEKAFLYFKKIRGTAMRILSQIKKYEINDLMLYDTNSRIIASLLAGYGSNLAFYREKNYVTGKLSVKLSKDSWMNYSDKPKKELMFTEIFIMNKKTDILIVSNVTSKPLELYEKFTLIQ